MWVRVVFVNNKDIIKYVNEISKRKTKCKCGHSVAIPPNIDKLVCHWCGRYVFKDKKAEFEYRIKEIKNKN